MLVLTRKVQEELIIAGNTRVRVLGIEGSRIRLGIDAPREVDIRRGELSAMVVASERSIPARESATPFEVRREVSNSRPVTAAK